MAAIMVNLAAGQRARSVKRAPQYEQMADRAPVHRIFWPSTGPPQRTHVSGSKSGRYSGAGGIATVDGAGAAATGSAARGGGAIAATILLAIMLIATNTRMPGHHQPCQARTAKPTSQTTAWMLSQGPAVGCVSVVWFMVLCPR